MFKLIFQLFFLWRRNNIRSTVLKASVFGALGGFLVGMFSDLRTALLGGAVCAGLAVVHYTLLSRRENAKLLQLFDGNEKAVAAFRKSQNNGMAGAVMTEFMRMGLEELDQDDEDEIIVSDADREANRRLSQENLDKTLAAIDATPGMRIEDREIKIAELTEELSQGDYPVDPKQILSSLLSDKAISTCMEDFCNEDDHADFIGMFAEASLGAWQPTGCRSRYDEDHEQWVVRFSEAGEPVEWRFKQSGDWISENFVGQLFAHIEQHSDRKIVPLETEDYCEWLLLPASLASRLIEAGLIGGQRC